MSTLSKQDRQASRTPTDLERRHAFGKSFAEVSGLASDARRRADEASVENAEDVINIINTSAEVIELKSNRLVVSSDHFSLTAEGDITATSGKFAGWYLSETGISKLTDTTMVQITSPEDSETDFITVAEIEGDMVLSVPLSIRANGDIYTTGLIKCSNTVGDMNTIIDGGIITVDGPFKPHGDSGQVSMLLMQFYAFGGLFGLYAMGYYYDGEGFVPDSVYIGRITE